VSFETLKAVTMKFTVFWNVTPFILVGPYKHFKDVNCLYFRGKRGIDFQGRRVSSLKTEVAGPSEILVTI
jgi:hypothetical protein